jgi:hypothetical protein
MNTTWGTMTQMVDRATRDALALDTLYAKLMEPPIGLKEGPIPVLLTALLLQRADDVAIYQEGTYQPTITAELLERLIKSPDRFAVKHFKLSDDRIQFIDAVARAIGNVTGRAPTPSRNRGVGGRNGALLSVTAPLLAMVRNLPAYTRQTNALSERARAVRETIQTAREPDELIFNGLPAALTMETLEAKTGSNPADFIAFSTQLEAALAELDGGYRALLDKCQSSLATELRLTQHKMPDLRMALRDRSQGLADNLLEPRLRSFVLLAANDDLDDKAWLEAVANNIAGRPAAGWRDEDVQRFTVELQGIAGAFRRYQALHFETLARNDKAGFDAHRITITAPDGAEYSDVVWVDDESKPQLLAAARQALEAAESLLGPRGGEALMALLAGNVVGTRHDGSARVALATPQRKARNA